MSSSPKTANVLSRPGVLGRLSDAHRRNSVLQSTGFHQCLGLLKKHPSKTPLARPGSTSICASKSTSIYPTICATTSAEGMFPSSVEEAVSPPRPHSEPRVASKPSRIAEGDRAAARAKRASFTGLKQRARIIWFGKNPELGTTII
jgi:hypothetical protein